MDLREASTHSGACLHPEISRNRSSASDDTVTNPDETPANGEKEKQDVPQNDPESNKRPVPTPVGFTDPELRPVHKQVMIAWARMVLILMTFILAVLSLYWAVLYDLPKNIGSLTVVVVSFDGVAPYTGVQPVVGDAVNQLAQARVGRKGSLGFVIQNASRYNNDPLAVRQAVFDEYSWAAIIVNSNASALLQQAVATGNQSYDPTGAIQVVYSEARQQDTIASYVLPQLEEFMTDLQADFGSQWIQRVLSNSSLSPSTYGRAPQALNPAIGASIFNLRPFGPPQATQAVSIGLIYLIILSFFGGPFFIPIYTILVKPQQHRPLHFWQWIIWRLFLTTTAYFFLSLSYSLVSLAFQIPFSNTFPHNDVTPADNPDAYGHASFVVYWMLNWVGMFALGCASENVTMVIGQPWTGMWLIFWVITNVSSAFYTVSLEPGFFAWARAWPLHNIVEASRTILFDTHSKIGLNFAVLLCWGAVNIAFFPFCCMFMRWKATREIQHHIDEPLWKFLLDG